MAGPSDLIITRSNPNDDEDSVNSDTDDIDHSGEKTKHTATKCQQDEQHKPINIQQVQQVVSVHFCVLFKYDLVYLNSTSF